MGDFVAVTLSQAHVWLLTVPLCGSQLATTITKYLREKTTEKRKGLLVSEVSAHGHLALLFLGHDEAEHHGRNM